MASIKVNKHAKVRVGKNGSLAAKLAKGEVSKDKLNFTAIYVDHSTGNSKIVEKVRAVIREAKAALSGIPEAALWCQAAEANENGMISAFFSQGWQSKVHQEANGLIEESTPVSTEPDEELDA